MAEDHGRLREIAWLELFPWLGLVRAARLAFAPRMLVLALLGAVGTSAGWGVIGSVFSGSDDVQLIRVREAIEQLRSPPLLGPLPPVSLWVLDPAQSQASLPWNALSAPFRALFAWEVTVTSFTYLLLCALWALIVWSLFGGAITRSAALWMAREDRLSFRRSLVWGMWKWPSYFGGPVFPLLGVLLAVIPAALVCWLLKSDAGVLALGIAWPLILACGLTLAILLVGLLFGWPLMWPTVSAEGTDSFDALSRSYSYTYQRPVHYLFYAAVAGILGTLAWIVVLIFANGVIEFSYWAASWGSGGARIREIQATMNDPQAKGMFGTGAHAIGFWVTVVKTIAFSFLFSYFWCAVTGIYFLLRQSVDGTELDEVAVDDNGEAYGLPPLRSEPGSVPEVVDTPG